MTPKITNFNDEYLKEIGWDEARIKDKEPLMSIEGIVRQSSLMSLGNNYYLTIVLENLDKVPIIIKGNHRINRGERVIFHNLEIEQESFKPLDHTPEAYEILDNEGNRMFYYFPQFTMFPSSSKNI